MPPVLPLLPRRGARTASSAPDPGRGQPPLGGRAGPRVLDAERIDEPRRLAASPPRRLAASQPLSAIGVCPTAQGRDAYRPSSPAAQQPSSPAAQQPSSPAAQQPSSPAAQQPRSPGGGSGGPHVPARPLGACVAAGAAALQGACGRSGGYAAAPFWPMRPAAHRSPLRPSSVSPLGFPRAPWHSGGPTRAG
jgi:hypothetical protein